jgi:GNAT superfamily N-acetyltransferase
MIQHQTATPTGSAKTARLESIRFATPADREKVQAYVRSLSMQSRYDRFQGGINELSERMLDGMVGITHAHRFTILATILLDGIETVVGEACYAFDADTSSAEFALSVHDRWQGRGLGKVLLEQVESLAAAAGAVRIFADTLRSNERIRRFAHVSGYASAPGSDWRLLYFEKAIPRQAPEIAFPEPPGA